MSTIKEILSVFNFDKVYKTMQALNWKYKDNNSKDYIPTTSDLKLIAMELLMSLVLAKDSTYISNGGFTARKIKSGDYQYLSLTFNVEEVVKDYEGI